MNLLEYLNLLFSLYEEKTKGFISEIQKENLYNLVASNLSEEVKKSDLSKKLAAKATHEFMREILKEPDMDWGSATNLLDIYDCRVCANAIAQVYVKGIMSPKSVNVFGNEEILSKKELLSVAKKVIYR